MIRRKTQSPLRPVMVPGCESHLVGVRGSYLGNRGIVDLIFTNLRRLKTIENRSVLGTSGTISIQPLVKYRKTPKVLLLDRYLIGKYALRYNIPIASSFLNITNVRPSYRALDNALYPLCQHQHLTYRRHVNRWLHRPQLFHLSWL